MKRAIPGLAGDKMNLARLYPAVEPRVDQAMCCGQYLTPTDQRTRAVFRTKTLNHIHSADRGPGPTIRLNGDSMIPADEYASRGENGSYLLGLSPKRGKQDINGCRDP
jgi:hypothetical protein